ncbi:hypothetical protein AVEN_258707-1, partial [Araneus ventricosus]
GAQRSIHNERKGNTYRGCNVSHSTLVCKGTFRSCTDRCPCSEGRTASGHTSRPSIPLSTGTVRSRSGPGNRSPDRISLQKKKEVH